MTIVCCVCKKVLVQAGPEFPVSHDVGSCCWDIYRKASGLPAKPYPVKAAA